MLKSLKSVLIICLVAVFGTFIVLEALGFRGKGGAEDPASASASEGPEQTENVSITEAEEQSESLSFISEPEAQAIVTVLVSLKGEPLLETAIGRGQTVQELYAGFDGEKLLSACNRKIDSAISSLSGLLISTGYRYTSIFNGFSARVRYGDIARIEKNKEVESVVLSNTYESPKAITENDVNVQGTGIFDSTGVDFDGTGTVVAVLDTGTDYTHEVFNMTLNPDTMALTKDDVAAAVPLLAATRMEASLATPVEIDEDELYLTSKLPYAFDYADIDTNVYPEEAHGTHVAGIIAGESKRIRGVAPRAQIATFKVFQDTGSSTSEGILAAVNDAVVLGVDAINMSLGATCGFSREEDEPFINEVYDLVEDSGVSLVVAAGNEYSSSYGGAHGNTNLASNPDSGTVGSPASYYASFAVASVSGVKTPYVIADGAKEIYYNESRTTGKTKPNNFVNKLLGGKDRGTYDYVVIPGVGYEANYTNINVKGKIAVVKRGSNSFEDKVKIAKDKGAVAVIIYNNLSGMLNMSIGTVNTIPSCLINMDYGAYLAARGEGKIEVCKDYLAGPFMSDFSSWGPLPNLELTPDITGHGGDITSSFPGGNEYDTISGTSMACPNIAGALVLVRQYVKSMEGDRTTPEVRDLSYNLMMSTATIARNEYGNPYSPRKQGAGIGDIENSVNTKAYLSVADSNKVKLSLKDDPTRKGEYKLTFNITNLSNDTLSYKINPLVMTESMSSDGKTVAELAYMLSPTFTCSVKATMGKATITNSTTLTVTGYAEAEITVNVKLSQADREYLNKNFRNGMYVEGFVELHSYNPDKIDLHVPFLAFYGNWTDAPMLDVSAYEVGESAVNTSVLPEDKLVADAYGTLPMAGFDTQDDYGNTQIGSWGLGAFGYNVAEGYALPVTRERYASLTHDSGGNYKLYAIAAGLFRNAKIIDMEIRDSVTNALIWAKTDYNGRKSHSNGGDQAGGSILVDFDVRNYNLANNGKYKFSMACYLDWGDWRNGERYGNSNTFSFEFYIDDEKPVLLRQESGDDYAVYVRDEDHTKELEFYVHDNHYLQAYLLYTYESLDENGEPVGLTSISNGVIPVYDGEFNGTTRVSLNVTPYWSTIEKNGGKLYVQFMDYAKNSDQFFVTLKECSDVKLEKTRSAKDREYTIRPGEQLDLEDNVRIYSKVEGEYLEGYWTKDLVWTSSSDQMAEVDIDGLVTGMKEGDATISVHPADGGASLEFVVHVKGTKKDIEVRELEMSEDSLRLERGETREIWATLKPYNYPNKEKLTITWTSSSQNVKVEQDANDPFRAKVTALRSGSATIGVRVQGTLVNATCSVRVQNEYYVDTVYLKSYTGRGDENGVVDIPDDLGIAYIYPMAFFQNPYITKIIIPEGVQYIMRAGIYGCDNLEEIVLPESCKDLQTFSVAWNPKLTKINTEHVQTIGSRAFIYDTALEEIDLSRATYISDMAFTYCTALKKVDLSKVGTVGAQAFQGCSSLTELVLPKGLTTSTAAFYQCTGLKHVVAYNSEIGPMTFQGCTALTDVTFVGDVDLIDVQAFYQCVNLKNVNFLGTVYEIGPMAFAYDSSLTSFTLPAGLTVLGQQAFVNCSGISTLYVDKDACIIESDFAAFHGLSNLTEYRVEDGNKYLASDENGVLYDKAMYRLISFPYGKRETLFKVPNSVRVIGPNAFLGTSRVNTVDLNKVERIEENAFRQSTVKITGGDFVTYIGAYAFAAVSSTPSGLTTFPISAATYIGDYAFANCTAITEKSLTLSDNVSYVGEFAFYGCPIQTLKIGNGLQTVGYGAFSHCTKLATVDFGTSLTALSPEMFASCTSLNAVTIPGNVKELGDYAFYGCTALRTVTLPQGLETIPQYCFNNTAISNISLPTTVTSIGEAAFQKTKVSDFNFSHIESIGDSAFEGSSLTSVSSTAVKSVGARAFYNSNLTDVSLPSAKTVGNYAFARCTSLKGATLTSATSIGANAFYGCSVLSNVYIGKAESLGDTAFRDTASLRTITLPAVKSLGASVFSGSGVTMLDIPNLQTVADRAFADATALKSISVSGTNKYFKSEAGVLYRKNDGDFYTLVAYPLGKEGQTYTVIDRTVKIGAYAFEDNTKLTKIVLPAHIKVIGIGAFYQATRLSEIDVGSVEAPRLESIGVVDDDVMTNTYINFKQELGKKFNLKLVVPKNATGYDSYIWKAYLGGIKDENNPDGKIEKSEKNAISASALDFIDRVKALSSLSGDEREAEIDMLKRIYNLFDSIQVGFVTEGFDGTDYHQMLLNAENGSASAQSFGETVAADVQAERGERDYLWVAALVLAVASCAAVVLVLHLNKGRREK